VPRVPSRDHQEADAQSERNGIAKGAVTMHKLHKLHKMDKIYGCFLLGVSVGVGIGMLVAPQTGEQTRGRLKAKADEGTGYLKQRGLAIIDSAAGLVGKGKRASTERGLDEEALQRMDGEGRPDTATGGFNSNA
jgi:gas vesicle protein